MADTGTERVLVVDDDPQVRLLYEAMLEPTFAVELAGSGEAAIAAIDDGIDAVLLDRRLGRLSGGEVLERIRAAGHDQPVGMVSALEPDFEVLEMGFDGYLVKPVLKAELRELVQNLLLRAEYDAVMREYFSLVAKVTALEQRKSPEELASNEAFAASSSRLELIKDQAHAALDAAIEGGRFDAYYEDDPSGLEPTDPDPPAGR